MERYRRNRSALSAAEQAALAERTVLVAGCGGLGGYVVECLARVGVGHIVAVDGDVFEESNLNRQLLSGVENLGYSKALAAAERVRRVNPLVKVTAVEAMLTAENAPALLAGCGAVVDAVDSVRARRVIFAAASALGIPYVHGAVAGWYGRVSVLYPGDGTLDLLYGTALPGEGGDEVVTGNLSFTCAVVGGIQAAETVKVLLGRGGICRDRLFELDLLRGDCQEIALT